MNNSEIKCEHKNAEILPCSDNIYMWCSACGAIKADYKDYWQLPTRTPEPTKAENRLKEERKLVPLDREALEKFTNSLVVRSDIHPKDWYREIYDKFGTKKENGLVKLNDELIETADKYANDLVVIKGQVEVWNKENQQRAHYQAVLMGATAELLRSLKTFGTPSITKEQLLAILPEKGRRND